MAAVTSRLAIMKQKPENKNLVYFSIENSAAVCESHAIVALTYKQEVALSLAALFPTFLFFGTLGKNM